jgi:hypothetical protein
VEKELSARVDFLVVDDKAEVATLRQQTSRQSSMMGNFK